MMMMLMSIALMPVTMAVSTRFEFALNGTANKGSRAHGSPFDLLPNIRPLPAPTALNAAFVLVSVPNSAANRVLLKCGFNFLLGLEYFPFCCHH